MKRIFQFIILLVLTVACSRPDDPRLDRINELTASNPQIAIDSLEAIDKSALSTSDRHYYDLLTIKANDKAYVSHTSDSLILDVIDYYKGGKDKTLFAEALYYGGRVYSDLGDYPSALDYFHQALEALPTNEPNLDLKSRILSQHGRLLNNLRLYEEAENYIKEAIRLNAENNDTLSWVYNLQLLGGINMRSQNYYNAEKYINESVKLSSNLPSHIKYASIMILANVKLHMGEEKNALNLIRGVQDKVSNVSKNTALAYAANIYNHNNIFDTAYIFCERIIESSDTSQKKRAYQLLINEPLKNLLPIDTLLEYNKRYRNIIEIEYDKNETELALLTQSYFNYDRHVKQQNEVENNFKTLRLVSIIIFIILSITTLIIFYLKFRDQKYINELNKAVYMISELRKKSFNPSSSLISKETMDQSLDTESLVTESLVTEQLEINQAKTDNHFELKKRLKEEVSELYKSNPEIKLPEHIQ